MLETAVVDYPGTAVAVFNIHTRTRTHIVCIHKMHIKAQLHRPTDVKSNCRHKQKGVSLASRMFFMQRQRQPEQALLRYRKNNQKKKKRKKKTVKNLYCIVFIRPPLNIQVLFLGRVIRRKARHRFSFARRARLPGSRVTKLNYQDSISSPTFVSSNVAFLFYLTRKMFFKKNANVQFKRERGEGISVRIQIKRKNWKIIELSDSGKLRCD